MVFGPPVRANSPYLTHIHACVGHEHPLRPPDHFGDGDAGGHPRDHIAAVVIPQVNARKGNEPSHQEEKWALAGKIP